VFTQTKSIRYSRRMSQMLAAVWTRSRRLRWR
jgi:hypothetical protein